MTSKPLLLAASFLVAAACAPTATEAQGYGGGFARPAPLYPYVLQPGQPYAVEVAPNTFVIHRPRPAGAYPYVAPRPRAHRGRRAVIHTRRVVERHHDVDGATPPRERVGEADLDLRQAAKAGEKRVIEADAVVTILGPDRMNIRLLRKRGANARAH
jgi:hypothetical protein